MQRSNRKWLPAYCQPDAYLPRIQETRTLFARPPYLFSDFVGRALSFLRSEEATKMGFSYDPARTLPCKWRCADESTFGLDLSIYACTGRYPFDKGLLGGRFNEKSLAAAVHHGSSNIDFGGSHVGYLPGSGGGSFGHIWRPLTHEHSTDCGWMMNVLTPFKLVYDDACEAILVFRPKGEDRVLLSVPNEFLQPGWSSSNIKLLIDTDALTAGDVHYEPSRSYTHTPIGRTLFYLRPGLLDVLPEAEARDFASPTPSPIGRRLTYHFFTIYDVKAELDIHGLPENKLLLYAKYILSARNAPHPLKAAIVNTNLEYNKLTDAVRLRRFRDNSFASFTGVFIDLYDEKVDNYVNLFQPIGLSLKPAGTLQITELLTEEISALFERYRADATTYPLAQVLGYDDAEHVLQKFTFAPGVYDQLTPLKL